MAKYARTLFKLELYDEKEVAPGLYSARDSQGMLRLHDGAIFRGYAGAWGHGRDNKPRFQAATWDSGEIDAGARKNFTRRTYRTVAGAERALLRKGVELHNAMEGR